MPATDNPQVKPVNAMLNIDSKRKTIYRRDYRVPAYLLDKVSMHFRLEPDFTDVHATLNMRRNPRVRSHGAQT